MKTKLIIIIAIVAVLIGGGIGTFFIVKNISEEQHKKDIEMAADCARSFERPTRTTESEMWGVQIQQEQRYSTETDNRRRSKREECAGKYHVTHQEIIDKIGTSEYFPE